MNQPLFALRGTTRRTGTLVAGIVLLLAFGASGTLAAGPGKGTDVLDAQGIVHARGHAPAGKGGGHSSPNLLFHSGSILTSSVVKAIFWGSSWNNPGDKITGIDSFYSGVDGSPYLNTNTEYTGTNGQVGTGVSYQGHVVDQTAGPTQAPSVSTILGEVTRQISNPVANGYYPVYVDLPRGNAGYCAWHSYGTVRGVAVQFGFFFRLDGDPGCDPQDSVTTHSEGLAALANVSGHELSETITDPRNGGWYDRQGAENADKCAWTFGGPVTFGGNTWKIQGNWSNAAYNKRSGYDGAGCIQTK
jgi:hypothetical protein